MASSTICVIAHLPAASASGIGLEGTDLALFRAIAPPFVGVGLRMVPGQSAAL